MNREPSIDELMGYMRQQIERDAALRRQLATAVSQQDNRAVARLARGVLKVSKAVAPYVIPVVLAMFGIYV